MVGRCITWFGEDILGDLASCILSSLGSFLRGSQILELTSRGLPLYNTRKITSLHRNTSYDYYDYYISLIIAKDIIQRTAEKNA